MVPIMALEWSGTAQDHGLRPSVHVYVLMVLAALDSASLSHETLQWRNNERDGVSNHQPHDCLLNRLFRHR